MGISRICIQRELITNSNIYSTNLVATSKHDTYLHKHIRLLTREPDDSLTLIRPTRLRALIFNIKLATTGQVELDKLHVDAERVLALTVSQWGPLCFF